MQVDFQMPGRLGAEYVAEDNSRKTPVMLHRAIVGSLERFIGMLIENYAGAMPPWLAPVQVAVANISEGQADYAEAVAQTLKKQGFRVDSDLRNEKITYKIRQLSLQKIPYVLVVGDKEKRRASGNAGGRACPRRGRPRRDAVVGLCATSAGRRRAASQRGQHGLIIETRRSQPSLRNVRTGSTVKSAPRKSA